MLVRLDRPETALLAVPLTLTCIGVAACGGSSKSAPGSSKPATKRIELGTFTVATSAAGTSAAGTSAAGRGATGGAAASLQNPSNTETLRQCLQRHGITLRFRKPGEPSSPGTGPRIPEGVTRAQYYAARAKCGHPVLGTSGFQRATFNREVTRWTDCMREHGIKMPAPNLSGLGEIFDTRHLRTGSPAFKSAEAQCRGEIPRPYARR